MSDTVVASDAVSAAESRRIAILLLAPAILFILVLFLVPVGYILYLSFAEPKLSIDHYERIATTPLYTKILINTFETAGIVTLCCLIIGYPLAYVMSQERGVFGQILLMVVAMSFWVGFVVRTYAWLVILGREGPVADLYRAFGVEHPPPMVFTSFASTLGMTHILLPYMVFALYSVMRKIEPAHLKAAASLGARPFATFRVVFFPLSLPGVVNGCVLVFTICLGFYVTPILLGTPREMMISQLISEQIEELAAWGFASALAMVLLACTGLLLAIYNRYFGLDKLWG